MATTHPRYQVTDTGRTRELIDRAAREWPELAGNRKALLLRLAETGAERIETDAQLGLEREVLRHVGEWVAIKEDRLLVASEDVGAVVAWLREHGVRAAAMYRVPDGEIGDFGEHGLT